MVCPFNEGENELTPVELSRRLGRSERTIRRWLAARQLTGQLVGGRWSIGRSDWRRFLMRCNAAYPTR
jgi:excisionase family DNA binding protein